MLEDNSERGGLQRFRSRVRPVAAALLVAISLNACTKWVAQTGPARDAMTARQERVAKVTMSDGTTREIFEPRVDGDSLRGYRKLPPTFDKAPLTLPLADIRSLELRRVSGGRTALLVVAGGTILVVAALMIVLNDLMDGFGDGFGKTPALP